MRRKVFDALVSTGGLVLAAILLVAGGLLVWAHTFVDNNVHTQLSQQQIFFPDKAGIAAQSNADITKYVTPYAGQQVVNGKQAQVFANHYIQNHLKEVADGQTYSQVSAEYIAASADKTTPAATLTKLSALRQTAFMGESLRGSLLSAYQAWQVTYLVIGLGALTLLGGTVALISDRKTRKVTVPETAATLTEPGLNVK